MKIVYCLNSIRYTGGIQRVTMMKANALANIPNNEVYVAVSDNKSGHMLEPLSDKVHLIDLDVNYYADDWKSKLHVIKGILIKRWIHRKKLAKFLKSINPDIVISVGQSEKNFLPFIKGNWKTIREFHFVRDYRRRTAKGLFGKILAVLGDLYEANFTLKKYHHIVVLTHEDNDMNWKGWKNVSVIPNPILNVTYLLSDLTEKKVISVGRLSQQKNFSSLINAWVSVYSAYPDWHLEIWGDGHLKQELNCLIGKLRLTESVHLNGYTDDVMTNYAKASLFVCSSNFEGFGMVILEAMSCGLPVVSYDCPCGPRDIITEGKDGYLVPMGDEQALAERICYLIEHEDERLIMGKAALEKSKQYALDIIIDKWMNLFRNLMGKE